MRQHLVFVAMIIIAAGIIGFFLISNRNQTVAGSIVTIISTTSPDPQYPKVEKYEVPILMYHYIRDAENMDRLGQGLSVSPANFELHMKYLRENDYETMKLVDLADPDLKKISQLTYEKKKPIIITFDDGYEDAYTAAFLILKKYKFIGTFFIIRNFVGTYGYLNRNQIAKMEKAGMEIGSHSIDHANLVGLFWKDQKKQIFNSKEKASIFCYPIGKYNANSVALVKEAGYLAAVTTKNGVAREISDLYTLPRVRVENISPQTLMNKIEYAREHL